LQFNRTAVLSQLPCEVLHSWNTGRQPQSVSYIHCVLLLIVAAAVAMTLLHHQCPCKRLVVIIIVITASTYSTYTVPSMKSLLLVIIIIMSSSSSSYFNRACSRGCCVRYFCVFRFAATEATSVGLCLVSKIIAQRFCIRLLLPVNYGLSHRTMNSLRNSQFNNCHQE